MKKYFDFTGRATRKRFNLFQLFFFAGLVIMPISAVLISDLLNPHGQATSLISFAFSSLTIIGVLFGIIAAWAMVVQRIRDIGWSMWSILLLLIPYVGLGYHLVLMFVPTDCGRNKGA
jgi:uncharacterized membrane protein YhaH (DUF805 family)